MLNSKDPISIESLLTDGRFTTPEEFSFYIEKESLRTKETILETIVTFCKEIDVEPKAFSKSLTTSLLLKLEAECMRNNLLTTKVLELPE